MAHTNVSARRVQNPFAAGRGGSAGGSSPRRVNYSDHRYHNTSNHHHRRKPFCSPSGIALIVVVLLLLGVYSVFPASQPTYYSFESANSAIAKVHTEKLTAPTTPRTAPTPKPVPMIPILATPPDSQSHDVADSAPTDSGDERGGGLYRAGYDQEEDVDSGHRYGSPPKKNSPDFGGGDIVDAQQYNSPEEGEEEESFGKNIDQGHSPDVVVPKDSNDSPMVPQRPPESAQDDDQNSRDGDDEDEDDPSGDVASPREDLMNKILPMMDEDEEGPSSTGHDEEEEEFVGDGPQEEGMGPDMMMLPASQDLNGTDGTNTTVVNMAANLSNGTNVTLESDHLGDDDDDDDSTKSKVEEISNSTNDTVDSSSEAEKNVTGTNTSSLVEQFNETETNWTVTEDANNTVVEEGLNSTVQVMNETDANVTNAEPVTMVNNTDKGSDNNSTLKEEQSEANTTLTKDAIASPGHNKTAVFVEGTNQTTSFVNHTNTSASVNNTITAKFQDEVSVIEIKNKKRKKNKQEVVKNATLANNTVTTNEHSNVTSVFVNASAAPTNVTDTVVANVSNIFVDEKGNQTTTAVANNVTVGNTTLQQQESVGNTTKPESKLIRQGGSSNSTVTKDKVKKKETKGKKGNLRGNPSNATQTE